MLHIAAPRNALARSDVRPVRGYYYAQMIRDQVCMGSEPHWYNTGATLCNTGATLVQHWLITGGSLAHHWRAHWLYTGCQLAVHCLRTGCTLAVNWLYTVCALTVH